jgi:hypothetical protein
MIFITEKFLVIVYGKTTKYVMQTVTSYYYDNTVEVQFDIDATCLTPNIPQRNRVVYTRTLQIYKGVTNVLKIEVKNANQKPIDVSGHTMTFNIVDDYVFANANVVLTANVTAINAAAGLGYVTLTGLDLTQLDREQYTYNVKINSCWGDVAAYVDDNYGAAGQLVVSSSAYPVNQPATLDLGLIGDPTTSEMVDFGTI